MRRLVFLAGLVGISFFFTLSASAYLKSSGRDIVDADGNKILLRGLGLGGWLVPEGYQLHIPGYGSPTSIRNQIIDVIGMDNTDQFYQRYTANYVNENDIRQIAQWGFNSIRLPFNYRMLTPENQLDVYLETGFQLFDQVLAWCQQYHLYLIFDMHCAPGGQNADNISDSDGIEARLWTNLANQDRTVAIWRKIAERYANEEWVGGYDLINEPVLPTGHSNAELRALYMRITQSIREVDPNHLIFIEGNWYATDFSQLTPPFDVNMAYSFHKYWNSNSTAAIQSYLDLRNQQRVPLWLGESGENSNPWFNDCVQLMEKNNIGWNWWTHKKVRTLTSPYSAPLSANYQRVLDYWNGTATKPTVEFASSALLAMADNLALEHCQFHPDVLVALFSADFSIKSMPFKQHYLPGKIDCADYDQGNNNVAYFDIDYQNTGGAGSGEVANHGSQYRNDGVDIESCNDADGAAYNIGWIESGEWLLYTVIVSDSGNYEVDLRTAANSSSGKLRFYLDNQPLTPVITVPNSGGWQNWQTITIDNVSLPAGTHLLKLLFIEGGFNINAMFFRLISSSIKESDGFVPVTQEVFVAQNYPNPFNNTTQIPIYLLQSNKISLKIYNGAGALVKTLVSGNMESGLEEVLWDGTNDTNRQVASGRYFCELSVNGSSKVKTMIFQK